MYLPEDRYSGYKITCLTRNEYLRLKLLLISVRRCELIDDYYIQVAKDILTVMYKDKEDFVDV